MFIRYNPGKQIYEYDSSPAQSGIGPWLVLPIKAIQIVDLPPPVPLPENIAFTNVSNEFTVQQIFNGITNKGHYAWVNIGNGVDLKKWHNFVGGGGEIVLYPVNDAESAVLHNGFRWLRNGLFTAESISAKLITAESGAGTGSGLESKGNLAVLRMFDAGGPVNARNWRFTQYNNSHLYLHLCDDADTVLITPIVVRPDNSVEFQGNFTQHNGGAHFPFRSSNTQVLDRYEEGTWAPRIWASDGGEGTSYGIREGWYTIIGDVCTAMFDVQVDAASWSSGYIYIILPFNASTKGSSSWSQITLPSLPYATLHMYVEPLNQRAHFPFKDAITHGMMTGAMQTVHFGPGSRIAGTMTFKVLQ